MEFEETAIYSNAIFKSTCIDHQRRILLAIDENPKSPILFKFGTLLDGLKLIKSSHYDFDL